MFYAQVVVRSRTQAQELTYDVPAAIVPYIKVGSLVKVPLNQKTVEGVIVGFQRTVAKEVKPKIRSIIEVQAGSVDENRIKLVKDLANYYGASLSEVAFWVFNRWGKLTLESTGIKISSTVTSKPMIVSGSWTSRSEFYGKLIEKYPKCNFMFVMAQKKYAEDLYQLLPNKDRTILQDDRVSTLKKVQKFINDDEPFYFITTITGVFLPLKPNDIMVIDQCYHFGNKQAHRPYMVAKTIALKRREIEHQRVILGTELPKVEDLPSINTRQFNALYLPGKKTEKLTISRRGSREVVVDTVMEEIRQSIDRREKVMVLALFKGKSSVLICRNCSQIVSCPNCHRNTLVNGDEMFCRYCDKKYPIQKFCPNCKADKLISIGEGVKQITAKLRSVFPGHKISELSSDQVDIDQSSDIIVATEKIFSYPQARFDLGVLASVDRLLTNFDLDNQWQLISMLIELNSRVKKLVIQTYLPDHPVWELDSWNNIRQLFGLELQERQLYRLPPYGAIIGLIGVSKREKLVSEATKITQELKKLNPGIVVSELKTEAFYGQNDQGSIEIIMKGQLGDKHKALILQTLPPSWHLDNDR